MQIDLTSDEKVTLLTSLSQRMGLSLDEILAVYLLLDDKIFFLFDLFQGKTIKFPTMRHLHSCLSLLKKVRIIKLKHTRYFVNGVESYREAIASGDLVDVSDEECVRVVGSPMVFMGGTYILAKDEEEENG